MSHEPDAPEEIYANTAPFIRVPVIFHSFQYREPFSKCVVCERDLLVDGTRYEIEKGIRRGEVTFEYAMCESCSETLGNELSGESIGRLVQYYARHRVDFDARRRSLLRTSITSADPWIERCLVTSTPRSECEEYQIYAQCDGRDLLFTHAPFLLSGAVLDDFILMLSPQTKDRLRDFVDDYLGLPPAFKDLLKERPVFV